MATPTILLAPEALPGSFRLPSRALLGSVALLVGSVVLSLSVGAAGLPIRGVVVELLNQFPLVALESGLTGQQVTILTQIRLPRVCLGGLVGASLAIAGAGYQGVFRNPLADPFNLGIAAGAGLGASVALVYDLTWGFGPLGAIQLLAFAGALLAVAVSLLIGSRTVDSVASLLLAGIATAAFFTALQTFLLSRDVDAQRSILAWLFGSLITASWARVGPLGFYLLLCGLVLLLMRRQLDVLRVGEAEATALGLNPGRVRLLVLVAASLVTAAAVSVSGLISFVGLVVPHVVRLTVGSSYRVVMPLSMLGGATFLILADVVARVVLSPAEVGIGVITAFVGGPFFALLLWRNRAGEL